MNKDLFKTKQNVLPTEDRKPKTESDRGDQRTINTGRDDE